MSEIRANTVSNAAGTGPVTLTGQYAAKAWVNFNGTGTIATRDSENVSSITDTFTGTTTVTLTTGMSDANYQISVTSGGTGGANGDSTFGLIGDGAPTTTTFSAMARDNNGNRFDALYVHASVNGDLA